MFARRRQLRTFTCQGNWRGITMYPDREWKHLVLTDPAWRSC
jgi:hypothetical protein